MEPDQSPVRKAGTSPIERAQGYYFLATYDPTYTDPRGRNFYASLSYSFR